MDSNFAYAKKKVGAFIIDGNVCVPEGVNPGVFKGLTSVHKYLVVKPNNTSYILFRREILEPPEDYDEINTIATFTFLKQYDTSLNPNFCLDITHLFPHWKPKIRVLDFFSVLRELPKSGGRLNGTEAYMLCHPIAAGQTPSYVLIEKDTIRIGYMKGGGQAIGVKGVNTGMFNRALKVIGFNLKIETPLDKSFDPRQPTLTFTELEKEQIRNDFEYTNRDRKPVEV